MRKDEDVLGLISFSNKTTKKPSTSPRFRNHLVMTKVEKHRHSETKQ